MPLEHLNWTVAAYVQKWNDGEWLEDRGLHLCTGEELLQEGVLPDEVVLWSKGNLLLNNGITRMIDLLKGTGSIAAYSNTVARIGVGNGTTGVAATDIDLSAASGSTNRWFQQMVASYPQVSAQTTTYQSSFGTTNGNFAWNEWGIDGGGNGSSTSGNTVGTNTSTAAALLNRVVPGTSLGTKTNGTWVLTATITIA